MSGAGWYLRAYRNIIKMEHLIFLFSKILKLYYLASEYGIVNSEYHKRCL